MIPTYIYDVTLVRVHDGDTIFTDKDLGFHTWVHATKDPQATEDQGDRFARINAPELRVSDATGKLVDNPAGLASRDALAAFIAGKKLTIQSVKREAHVRFLIELYADGMNVNDWLVTNNYAIYETYS